MAGGRFVAGFETMLIGSSEAHIRLIPQRHTFKIEAVGIGQKYGLLNLIQCYLSTVTKQII